MSMQRIVTDKFIIEISDDNREIKIRLTGAAAKREHDKALYKVVNQIWEDGVDRINADHISLPFLDRSINLYRGDRRLDIVFYKGGRIYECEVKTAREIGEDRTYTQLRDMCQRCQNFKVYIPKEQEKHFIENLKLKGLSGVIRYDCY